MLDEIDLGEMYYWMATQRGREIKHALEMCAAVARDGPVLIHCTHGKDRTGVLVALLLYVCGASVSHRPHPPPCFLASAPLPFPRPPPCACCSLPPPPPPFRGCC